MKVSNGNAVLQMKKEENEEDLLEQFQQVEGAFVNPQQVELSTHCKSVC